jgi:hypothetical protein
VNRLTTRLLGLSVRTCRIVAFLVVLLGIASAYTAWTDMGALWGILILALHVYLGLWIAFGLPWLQHRYRVRSSG